MQQAANLPDGYGSEGKGEVMRFFHTADIHLGASPDAGFPWGARRKEEIWESFRRLIARAKEEKPELLLIAGDLFHRQPLLRELKEVNYLFSTIAETKVVLIAGNHDYWKHGSFYEGFHWCPNVACLGGADCQKVVFPEFHTAVYGLSYHSREIREPLYDGLRPEKDGMFSILLAHGGDERHIPMDRRRMLASGFDYIALGHIHKPQILEKDRMAYAGALEPLDKNDCGPHGFLAGEYEKGKLKISFVPWAARDYRILEIDTDEGDTDFSLEEKISRRIRESGRENIYRIHMTGFRDPDIVFQTERYRRLGNVVEILDDTEPAYDFDGLRETHEEDVIGCFIRRLYRPGMDEVTKKALAYGVQALLEVRS